MREDEIFRVEVALKDLETKINAALKLDATEAEKEIKKLMNLVNEYAKKVQTISDPKKLEAFNQALSANRAALQNAAQGIDKLKQKTKQTVHSQDELKKSLDGVKYSFVLIARDAPYGLMGILNNIEMLTDAVVRLRAKAASAGQSISAFGALFRGFTALFTTTTGVLAVVGAAILMLSQSVDTLNRVFNNAIFRIGHFFRTIAKNIGIINDFADGLKKLGDIADSRMDLGNIASGFEQAKQTYEVFKQMLKEVEKNQEELRKKGIVIDTRNIKEAILELERFIARQGEVKDVKKGEMLAKKFAEKFFPDRELPILESYRQRLADIQSIRDELFRREQEIFNEYNKINAEIALQTQLWNENVITTEEYRKKISELNLELAQTNRELKETQDAILIRTRKAKIETQYNDAIAEAQGIWNNLARREAEARAEIDKVNQSIALQSELFRRGGISNETFQKEVSGLQAQLARLDKELKDIGIERRLRQLQAQKIVIEADAEKLESQIEKLKALFAKGTKLGLPIGLAELEFLSAKEEELYNLRQKIVSITAQEHYLRQEVYNVAVEKEKELLKYTNRRKELEDQIAESNIQIIGFWARTKKEALNKTVQDITKSQQLLDFALMRGKLSEPDFRFTEEKLAFDRQSEIEDLRLQISLQEHNLKLLEDIRKSVGETKELKDAIFAKEMELVKLQLQLRKLESSRLLEATQFYEIIGQSFAGAISEQIKYNSLAAQLDRDRTIQQIAEERRRIDERKSLLAQEHEDIIAATNELVGRQQVTQAEAAKRLVEAEKKRSDELEELRKKETELLRKEQMMRQKDFSQMVMANITNSVVELISRLLVEEAKAGRLNLLTAAFVVPAAIVLGTTIKGMLENMMVSFAEGRMFTRPTQLGQVMVGDARQIGQPVNFEALLNAAQLAEFGKRYAQAQATPIVINITTELNATQLVEKFEEQKIVYQKIKMKP